jgi:hypothetical protein
VKWTSLSTLFGGIFVHFGLGACRGDSMHGVGIRVRVGLRVKESVAGSWLYGLVWPTTTGFYHLFAIVMQYQERAHAGMLRSITASLSLLLN